MGRLVRLAAFGTGSLAARGRNGLRPYNLFEHYTYAGGLRVVEMVFGDVVLYGWGDQAGDASLRRDAGADVC